MISEEQRARIRRLYYAEHWPSFSRLHLQGIEAHLSCVITATDSGEAKETAARRSGAPAARKKR
jgi:hypothetical protein